MAQVNNAGINYNIGSENSFEFAEKVIATNYFGTKQMIETMIPIMKPSSCGARILNVTSRLGRINGRRNVSWHKITIFPSAFCVRAKIHINVPNIS